MGFIKSILFLIFYNLRSELYGDDGSVPRHREHEDGNRHFYSDDDGSRSEDSAYDNEYYSSQDDDRSNLFGW